MGRVAPASIPTHPIERGYWIIGQLRLKGLSLRSLAKKTEIHAQSLSYALRAPHLPAETIIAAALDIEVPILFSDRYAPDGTRLSRARSGAGRLRPRNAKGGKAA